MNSVASNDQPPASCRITGIGPPNAVAGQNAGARQICKWRPIGETLAFAP